MKEKNEKKKKTLRVKGKSVIRNSAIAINVLKLQNEKQIMFL